MFPGLFCCSEKPFVSKGGLATSWIVVPTNAPPRLSKAGVGSHRPTPYVGHQAHEGPHLQGRRPLGTLVRGGRDLDLDGKLDE